MATCSGPSCFRRTGAVYPTQMLLLLVSGYSLCGPAVGVMLAAPLPVLRGVYDTPSTPNANDVFVVGQYAYVVTDNNTSAQQFPHEFYIIDVSNPAAPVRVGSLDIGADVNAVIVSGNYAYLATSADAKELTIVSVANKSAPIFIGAGYDAPGGANGMAVGVSGTTNITVYLGTQVNSSGAELYALNVTNPASPILRDTLEIGADVNNIKINSTKAYLATSHNAKELIRVAIHNPSDIAEDGSYDTPGTADADGVDFRWGNVYVGTANNGGAPDFFVISAPPTSAMTLLGSLDLNSDNTEVFAYRDKVYVGSRTAAEGLTIIDVANPSQPTQQYTYAAQGEVLGIFVNGSTHLATSGNSAELEIVDTEFLMRPNIVLLYTDDQRYDSLQYMPKLQNQLTNNGVKFTNAFVTTPICCPSRASLLTGRYAHNTGMIGQALPNGGARLFAEQDTSTIATWLQAVGYRTGLYGKYLNDYQNQCTASGCYRPPGWGEWHAFKEVGAYYNYHLTNNDGPFEYHGILPQDYSTDVLSLKGVDFIGSSNGQPFFLFMSYYAPHFDTYLFPPIAVRHQPGIPGFQPIHGPAWDEEDVSDKPSYYAARPRASDLLVGSLTLGQWSDDFQAAAAGSLLAVDDGVALIRSALAAVGELDDTIIVFSTDNGFMWGEHRHFYGKECPHDECVRVPLIVSYPRQTVLPRQDGAFALNIDFAPTFAEYAGAVPATPVDGVSLKPRLRNQPGAWRNDFLLEQLSAVDSATDPPFSAVRNNLFKYVESTVTVGASTIIETQLYNLAVDPYELENQTVNPTYGTVKTVLKARLEVLKAN